MAGLRIVPVACDAGGNIDLTDLRAKAQAHQDDLAALMVTYPSTTAFSRAFGRCQIVHDCGGQVYMDGANMNAQVGSRSSGGIGADVCHINLHKTFVFPHGAAVRAWDRFAWRSSVVSPSHPVVNLGGENPIGAVAAAPGSASIPVILWVYIALTGEPD